MFASLHDILLSEKDFLEALSYLATVFALFVPLPIFVASTVMQRRREAEERAYQLIEKLDTADHRALRDRILKIIMRDDVHGTRPLSELNADEKNDLRAYMNVMEFISFSLNLSRIERAVFYNYWRSSFIVDWERFRPYVYAVRSKMQNADLYTAWEIAVAHARRSKRRGLWRRLSCYTK